MGIAARKKLTYRDFLKFPDDGNRHELIDGEWITTPPPTLDHQRVVANILDILRPHVRKHELGEVLPSPLGVVLTKHNAVQPDIVFVMKQRRTILKKDGIHGAPDLAIEVLSPSTASFDRDDKLKLYRDQGVTEYWMADLFSKTVEVRWFKGTFRTSVFQIGQQFKSDLLPGLSVKVDDVFFGV